jgi:pyruvate dehydrogenase (quinone)
MEETVGESLRGDWWRGRSTPSSDCLATGSQRPHAGFRRVRDALRFVLVHHQEAAAFMATGCAKASGRLGVCCTPSGPEGIHLLNGLYDATLDHARVLALTGMQERSVLGTRYQEEVHLDRLYADVAAYNLSVTNPQQLPGVLASAVDNALAKRTVVHLTFPNDIQIAPVAGDPYRHAAPATPPVAAPISGGNPLRPSEQEPRVGADLLGAGREGRHARRCRRAPRSGRGPRRRREADGADHQDVARQGGRPRRPSPDHGRAGLLGTKPSEELMEECDTLLMVGTSFPHTKADFAAWAWACGGFGAGVRKPGDVEPAIRDLLAHPGPGIVSYQQAKHFTEAFLRGQPHKVSTQELPS